jgi:thiamine-phosphate pyrophosphorylase
MTDALPRFYLVTPEIDDIEAFVPLFEDALGAADIACLLIRCASSDEGTIKRNFKRLAAIAQPRGIACLVPEATHLAARIDADGVHLDARTPAHQARLDEALDSAKQKRIVGIGGLAARDDAMSAGEGDVDYLMFGDDKAVPEATIEQVAWWAEIFNVPCVGFAGELTNVADLAAAGADFIAICDAVWLDPRGPATALTEAKVLLTGASASFT